MKFEDQDVNNAIMQTLRLTPSSIMTVLQRVCGVKYAGALRVKALYFLFLKSVEVETKKHPKIKKKTSVSRLFLAVGGALYTPYCC